MRERSGLEQAANIANMCRKLANIAKAALVGGLKGAALETAKSFAPTIVKIVIGVIIALILLPYLVIAAIPNILFGFNTNSSFDVTAMTDKAKVIEEAYKTTQDYNAKHVRELIKEMSVGYDDIQVNQNIGNLNDYWFIAICSVAYNQDLFSMNEEDIKNRTILGFSFQSSEEEYTEGEGETIKKLKRIKINVKELNPEELMNSLGFSDEQKNWAKTIYNSMVHGKPEAIAGPDLGGIPPEALQDEVFAALMNEATKYIGRAYVWGGSSPETGFDCSGFVCWSFTQSGVHNLPRTTAQGIFNQCTPITKEELKPGDLVFFTGTYDSDGPVSHIGIYVGDNKMLHCGDPIGYANIETSYWLRYFYSFGRLN